MKTFSTVPWSHSIAVTDDVVMDYYAVDGVLPGRMLCEAVRFWHWRTHIAVFSHILHRGRGDSMDRVRVDMARIVYEGVNLVSGEHCILPKNGFDISHSRN